MWISRKEKEALFKRIAALEKEIQRQREEIHKIKYPYKSLKDSIHQILKESE